MEKTRKQEFENVKKIIECSYDCADCGIFNTRNLVGDPMETVYEGKYFTVDICFSWAYFEVFGATEKEWKELETFYNKLGEDND